MQQQRHAFELDRTGAQRVHQSATITAGWRTGGNQCARTHRVGLKCNRVRESVARSVGEGRHFCVRDGCGARVDNFTLSIGKTAGTRADISPIAKKLLVTLAQERGVRCDSRSVAKIPNEWRPLFAASGACRPSDRCKGCPLVSGLASWVRSAQFGALRRWRINIIPDDWLGGSAPIWTQVRCRGTGATAPNPTPK